MSNSNSHMSLSNLPEVPFESLGRRPKTSQGPVPISPSSNGMSQPLPTPVEEPTEPEMKLDLDLTDMEGIVDTSIAAVPPSAGSTSTVTDGTLGSLLSEGPAGVATSSFATTVSTGSNSESSGSMGSENPPKRSLVSHADGPQNPFTQANPFSPSAINASFSSDTSAGKPNTPPSPHTLIPRNNLPPSTQPRRPSQLRNMGLPLQDNDSGLQPLTPTWGATPSGASTVFNTDPFGTGIKRFNRPTGLVMTPPVTGFHPQGMSTPPSQANSAVSPGTSGVNQYFPNMPVDGSKSQSFAAAVNAAWAAPESWGVEGDEDDDESTEEDELDGAYIVEEPASPEIDPKSTELLSASPDSKPKPPPFGYNSRGGKQGTKPRPGTSTTRQPRTPGSGRPPTGNGRPGTGNGRPGTAGSAVVTIQVSAWEVTM
jgi:adenylate cyclase